MWNSLLKNLAVAVAVGAVALMKQTDTTFWELVPEERTFSEEYVAGEETYTIQFDNSLKKYYGNDYEAFIFELSLKNKSGEILQQFSFDAEEYFGYWFEDLNFDGYPDLVVNYFYWGKNNFNNFYVWLWEPEAEKFCEEEIALYLNYEIVAEKEVFISKYADMREQSYEACRIEGGEVVELQRFYLDFYNGIVSIEDCISGEILYEGPLEEDEEGNLLNREFYEDIFWREIDPLN